MIYKGNKMFSKMLSVTLLIIFSFLSFYGCNNEKITESSEYPILYSKNNTLYMTNEKFEVKEVTDKIYSYNLKEYNTVSNDAQITNDSKTIYYKKNIAEDGTGSLYKLNVKNNESIEIAKNVYDFNLNKNTETLAYRVFEPDETFTLYCYIDNKSTEIVKGLDRNSVYFIANNGNNIVYKKQNVENGNFYAVDLKNIENQLCLSENVAGYSYNRNADKIYYVDVVITDAGEQYNLYLYDFINSPQLIDEGVSPYVRVVGNDETLFYYKSSNTVVKASDYVIDDMAQQDSTVYLPDPLAFSGKTLEEYMIAEAAYESKVVRDNIRQFISTTDITIPLNTLCMYRNGEKSVVSENVFESYSLEAENSFVIYSVFDINSIPKVNISQIAIPSDITNMISDSIQNSVKNVYICKSGNNPVLIEGYNNVDLLKTTVSAKGDKIIFFDSYIEETGGKLVIGSFDENGNITKYFEPVNDKPIKTFVFDNISGNTAYYYTNENGINVLEYSDGNSVKSVVENTSAYCFGSDNGILYYIEQTNSETGAGNLYYTDENEEKIKIAENVYFIYYIGDGKLVYMTQENGKSGNMYIFENGKSQKADTDVKSLYVYK